MSFILLTDHLSLCDNHVFQNPTTAEIGEFKNFILEKCDDNGDGKISMPEVGDIFLMLLI